MQATLSNALSQDNIREADKTRSRVAAALARNKPAREYEERRPQGTRLAAAFNSVTAHGYGLAPYGTVPYGL